MPHDASAPATKEDVQWIMEYLARNAEGIHTLTERMDGLEADAVRHKKEIIDQFHVVAENIRHDAYHGALADKVAQHEDRIVVLERGAARR